MLKSLISLMLICFATMAVADDGSNPYAPPGELCERQFSGIRTLPEDVLLGTLLFNENVDSYSRYGGAPGDEFTERVFVSYRDAFSQAAVAKVIETSESLTTRSILMDTLQVGAVGSGTLLVMGCSIVCAQPMFAILKQVAEISDVLAISPFLVIPLATTVKFWLLRNRSDLRRVNRKLILAETQNQIEEIDEHLRNIGFRKEAP